MFIHGLGAYLPPTAPNTDNVGVAGRADNMWPVRCVAGPDDHPASMATRALTIALERAQIAAADLALIVYCGRARDYLASWSVATEVARAVGAGPHCVGLDVALGCATLPAALTLAHGWLVSTRKYVAIVDAEWWGPAIDRTDPNSERLWAYGDGAAAMIVSAEPGDRAPLATWIASAFATHAAYNGLLIPEYGGTIHPHAPDEASQSKLRLDGTPAVEVFGIHSSLYEQALVDLHAQAAFETVDQLVCSQLSPAWVDRMVARFHRPRPKAVVNTGRTTGHLGGVDLILGLETLATNGALHGTVVVAGTAPYTTALALFQAP